MGTFRMPQITILPLGKTIEVAEGSTVLEEGRKSLSKIARAENKRLDQIVGAGSKSRLACQAKLGAEDITAEILGFGSGF